MKIRHPMAVKVLGFAVACLIRVWIGTVRFRWRWLGPKLEPDQRGLRERYLYAFWHEDMLMPAYRYGHTGAHVLVSTHADGEIIATACRQLGLRLVRGSSTRDAVKAVRAMLRSRGTHLVVTPDGPRGPRRTVQPGLVWLAARTGLPILALGFAYRRAWRTKSWDHMALPRPFSSVVCVQAAPIHVPEDVRKEQLETYRLRVEEAFRRAEEGAHRLLCAAPHPGAYSPGAPGAPAREAA